LAEVGRVDHEAATDEDSDVVDVGRGAEEDQISREKWLPCWNMGTGVILGLGSAGQ
jgi:hypothetical protein